MAQFKRPTAALADGSWVTTPLWSKIDEVTPDDGDEIQSSDDPSSDECAFTVNSGSSDPLSSSDHILRVRHKYTTTGGGSPPSFDLVFKLRQGPVTRASMTVNPANDTWVTDSYTLSGAEADSITNYNLVHLRLNANKTGGARTGRVHVSWIEFEFPDPAGGRRVMVIS